MVRGICIVAVWLVIVLGITTGAAGCRETPAFGHERREGLNDPYADGLARPREISVALPFPADFSARCGERKRTREGAMLTFFLDGEDAVPVLAPDEGTFHVVTHEGHPRYSITTVEQTRISLGHLQYPRVADGELVYRGEPIGVAGGNEYWSQSIGIEVVPFDPRAPVVILAQDAFDPSATRLQPGEFECGVVDGHIYRSGNFSAVNFPRGTLIRDRWSEKVYRVERDGVRREVRGSIEACAIISSLPLIVVSDAAFACLRLMHDPVQAETICAESGEFPFGDGALMRLSGGDQVWVVEGSRLRPMVDHGTFLLTGYAEGAVRDVPIESLRGLYHFAIDDPWRAIDVTRCVLGEPYPEAPL